MNVNIYVTPTTAYISTAIPAVILEELSNKLKYHVQGSEYTPKGAAGLWDGSIRLFKRRDRSFPAGCTRRVVRLLKNLGCTCTVEYSVNYPPLGDYVINGLTPFKFQFDCAEHAIKGRYGIVQAPMGAGKTAIIGLLLAKIQQYPTWVVTYGLDLVVQTRDKIEEYLKVPVGVFSESKFEKQDIIVTSYAALCRLNGTTAKTEKRNAEILESINQAKVLILDECHCALSPKMLGTTREPGVFSKFINTSFKIGLSGTPKPKNKSTLELEAAIGPILVKVPFKQLIELKRITKPVVLIYDLPSSWFSYHLGEFPEWYEANIVRNVLRNKLIGRLVNKLNKQNKTCFVMVRKRYHGELLQELIPRSVYVHGDIDSDTRKELYARLQKKEISCIISTVGKLGLDIPNLNAIINAEGYEAETNTLQKMRSLRASSEKEYGIVIDFMDKGMYLRDHSDTRLGMYKGIDGFVVKEFNVDKDLFKDETNE